MQTQGKSGFALGEERNLLAWMGTAYGRRGLRSDAKPQSADAMTLARALATTVGRHRRLLIAGAGILIIASAIALTAVRGAEDSESAARLVEVARAEREAKAQLASAQQARSELEGKVAQLASQLAALRREQENAERAGTAARAALAAELAAERKARAEAENAAKTSQEALARTDTRAEIERAEREAKAQLASAQQARSELGGKVAQLTSQLALQRREQENAERASTAAQAELAAERKARAEAEDAAKASKEALTRMASGAAPARVTPAPLPPNSAQAQPEPAEPARVAAALVAEASYSAAANSDAATSALIEGQKLLAKGDLKSARQRFEQAARLGLPEGALALGNTYDPVSLAKAGMKPTGDPARARQWYRRAYELAQSHQEPRR